MFDFQANKPSNCRAERPTCRLMKTPRHGAVIHDVNGIGLCAQVDQRVPMEPLLDHPEIGRLLCKRGPRSRLGKPRQPVTTEVFPEADIGALGLNHWNDSGIESLGEFYWGDENADDAGLPGLWFP